MPKKKKKARKSQLKGPIMDKPTLTPLNGGKTHEVQSAEQQRAPTALEQAQIELNKINNAIAQQRYQHAQNFVNLALQASLKCLNADISLEDALKRGYDFAEMATQESAKRTDAIAALAQCSPELMQQKQALEDVINKFMHQQSIMNDEKVAMEEVQLGANEAIESQAIEPGEELSSEESKKVQEAIASPPLTEEEQAVVDPLEGTVVKPKSDPIDSV